MLGVRVETNIPKNSKAIIMLALCPGRCLLDHKGIENDRTIFFHVTARDVKFAVSQRPNSHPFNSLYEKRLHGGNEIFEILYSRLKKIIRDSRILVDTKDFLVSWTFVQKLLLAGRGALLKKEVWERRNAVPTPNIKEDWFAYKNFHTGFSCFTLVKRCYTRDNLSFIHLCFSRRYT